MPNTDEQRKDILEICEILLQKLYQFQETDNTPEGRMISQLKWLRERAANYDLKLPVDPAMLSTLRRVDLDGELRHLATSPEHVHEEIEIYMTRLIKLTKNGELLLKPIFYTYALRCVDALIVTFKSSHRQLDQYEHRSIDELIAIRNLLTDKKIEPPLAGYFPNYKNLRQVFSITGNTIDDIAGGKWLAKTVANLIFEGIRPNDWLTQKPPMKPQSSGPL